MSDDERAAQRERCIEVKRVFHDVGLSIIEQLAGLSRSEQMVVDEQIESNKVVVDANEGNEVEIKSVFGHAD